MNNEPTEAVQSAIDALMRNPTLWPATEQPELALVCAWLQECEELSEALLEEAWLLVKIPDDFQWECDDDALREARDLDEEVPVDDAQRVDYMRGMVAKVFQNSDPNYDIHYTLGRIQLQASDGSSAVLGFMVKGYSYSGITYRWLGVFHDWEAIVAHVKGGGYLTDISELDLLSAESLLSWWNYE